MAALSNLKQCPPLSDLVQRHNHIPELEAYPRISLHCEFGAQPPVQLRHGGHSFVAVDEGILKRLTRTFFDTGFRHSLEEARSPKTRQSWPLVARLADWVAQCLDAATGLRLKVFPHTQPLSPERIALFAETRNWLHSDLRYLAWHPHHFLLAVAGLDDGVHVYTKRPSSATLLKCPQQSDITCMAWRPLCAGELVVGCQQGLVFWTVDNSIQLGRSNTPSDLFRHPSRLPISSLQWSKDGTLLVTSSIGDRAIIVWQPDNQAMQPLKRLGPPGCLLRWSPGNDWLFAGTVDRVFRVWHCSRQWRTERWVCAPGESVQAACWSPCGRYLLFVSSAEPILYRLQFVQPSLIHSSVDEKEVLPIADLNACSISANHTLIGGPAQQLAWDPHGNYLVVTFKSTNSIAVFRTFIQKFDLQISAAYYISGETPSEYASFICFQPLYKEGDRSVLTIAWSSGRVQYHAFD
ncbi:hypothetical protein KR018_005562 [Drosophila ironensis]|nr:hypothetical protein KR018_005562 [Drosophila ironensis]